MGIAKDLLLIFILFICLFLYKKIKKEREYFINTLSHDLRVATIAQIRGLEFLEKNLLKDEEIELIKEISNSCKFSFDMINMLLNNYKYQKGEVVLNYEDFNISNLIISACKTLENLCCDKKIKLNFKLDSNLIIYADKRSIFKAITILINTAINKAISNSFLSLKLSQTNQEYIISITYKGKSLSEEECKRMFSNKSRFTTVGEGIKLEICKKIIEFHKGKIVVQNCGKNLNSFTFMIPKKNKDFLLKNASVKAFLPSKNQIHLK